MMFLERALLFFPTTDGDWHPAGLDFEDVHFTAADGTRLHGWYLEHPRPRAVILYMHGNGGNLTYSTDFVVDLRERCGSSVMIFDYRGYGRSEGRPDEPGIVADARAARDWLAKRAGIAPADVVLLGNSLGGGVAVELAVTDGARALILQNTFTSLPDVAAYHYPFMPCKWLMRNRLESIHKIERYSGPVLQSHGTADSIVPMELGRRLYEAIPDPGKQFIELPGRDHNDDPHPQEYLVELNKFLDRLELERPVGKAPSP
jgi:hypothetical protein